MRDGKRDVVNCARSCARGAESGFRKVVTVINVDTSSFRPVPSYELKNDSTLQSMFAEHGSARRRGALRRAAMDFVPIFSQGVSPKPRYTREMIDRFFPKARSTREMIDADFS